MDNDHAFTGIKDKQLEHCRVLIVDDDEAQCLILEDYISSVCTAYVTHTSDNITELCAEIKPDLILLDIFLEENSGLTVCKNLKAFSDTSDIPVIFVTSSKEFEEMDECWNAGCVDFISKPVSFTTLTRRVSVHLQLKLQAEKLEQRSFRDGLTGLYNRSYLDHIFPTVLAQSNRTGKPLSLLMVDIDWFKNFNDHYGHVKGDECIRKVANATKVWARRPVDMLFRYGGEEFLCILPETDEEGVKFLAEKIIDEVKCLKIPHEDSVLKRVSVSIGTYTLNQIHTGHYSELVDVADHALYEAKSLGRDQFRTHQ